MMMLIRRWQLSVGPEREERGSEVWAGGGGGVAGTSAATCQRPLSKAFGKVNMFPAVCAIVPKHVGDDVSTYFWH